MKKKLDTRFPAARIKKIMQSDDEVGKIALATPVLISKALELFLQDLCDKVYKVTSSRGVKTLNGSHLKECVSIHTQFDFLKEVVAKVSDNSCNDEASDDNSRNNDRGSDCNGAATDEKKEVKEKKKRPRQEKASSKPSKSSKTDIDEKAVAKIPKKVVKFDSKCKVVPEEHSIKSCSETDVKKEVEEIKLNSDISRGSSSIKNELCTVKIESRKFDLGFDLNQTAEDDYD